MLTVIKITVLATVGLSSTEVHKSKKLQHLTKLKQDKARTELKLFQEPKYFEDGTTNTMHYKLSSKVGKLEAQIQLAELRAYASDYEPFFDPATAGRPEDCKIRFMDMEGLAWNKWAAFRLKEDCGVKMKRTYVIPDKRCRESSFEQYAEAKVYTDFDREIFGKYRAIADMYVDHSVPIGDPDNMSLRELISDDCSGTSTSIIRVKVGEMVNDQFDVEILELLPSKRGGQDVLYVYRRNIKTVDSRYYNCRFVCRIDTPKCYSLVVDLSGLPTPDGDMDEKTNE